jgi:type II secretory ATPase GspE/PulE/Tfp pilus assembly ATPase PilB-like protein
MQSSASVASAWRQLKDGLITCDEALAMLVDANGVVNLKFLDAEVSYRFFREFPDRQVLPPLLPLVLWRNCFYLGSPADIDAATLQDLRDHTLTDIRIVAIADKSYRAWFHASHHDPDEISSAPLIDPLTGETAQEDLSDVAELYLEKAAGQISRIRTLISAALRNRASDIHLEPSDRGLRVRYRIDGILREIATLPADIGRRTIVALKVMSSMDISESRRPQDGRIGENYASDTSTGIGLDMRVSTLPCIGGEKAVIRLLPQENPFSTLDHLGFSPETLATYVRWLRQPQGIVILTGPTGSGKTSTLYTSLQAIATEQVNVVTVEDPVEYVLSGIVQTQVNERAGMTFAAGLRAILRQDPDIIMVGEIRDAETAETAIRAALTGHLVLTTLHTNDAISSIPRLKDIGPDPGLISDAILGIVAQRLVRQVCPHCAEPYAPSDEELAVLGLSRAAAQTEQWRKGSGCPNCFNSGYLGRQAIVELLDADDTVRELIYGGTTTQLAAYLLSINYPSFRQAAIAKVTAGLTTVSEVLRVLPHSALSRKARAIAHKPPEKTVNPLLAEARPTLTSSDRLAADTVKIH